MYSGRLSLRGIASILLIVIVTVACERRNAPAESAGPTTGSTAVSVTAPPPRPAAADLVALNRILHHHERTVALAQGAADRAVHSELREFIGNLLRDRRQEIDELRRLGATRTAAVKAAPELEEAPHETVDVLFVTALVVHEEEGRAMATELLATTTTPNVKSFAEGLITKAGSEVTQLNAWREQWSKIGHLDR